MAVTAAQLMVQVMADISHLQQGLSQANREIQGAANHMERSVGKAMTSIGSSMSSVGRGMTLGITLPLVTAGALMTRTAIDATAEWERLGIAVENMARRDLRQFTSEAEAIRLASDASKELLGWMEKLAIQSPFDLPSVATGYRLMNTGVLSPQRTNGTVLGRRTG